MRANCKTPVERCLSGTRLLKSASMNAQAEGTKAYRIVRVGSSPRGVEGV